MNHYETLKESAPTGGKFKRADLIKIGANVGVSVNDVDRAMRKMHKVPRGARGYWYSFSEPRVSSQALLQELILLVR